MNKTIFAAAALLTFTFALGQAQPTGPAFKVPQVGQPSLEVHPERMARNLDAGGGLVYSHRVLLALVESGMAREDAYRAVQSAALRALNRRCLRGHDPREDTREGDAGNDESFHVATSKTEKKSAGLL